MKKPAISIILLVIFLAGIYTILLAQKINLTTADLGRHLKNGELFLQNFSVPQGNLYSYTNPDYTFVNHHWGSGVVFYLIYGLAGFKGLSIFFILTGLATFFIFFHIASKYSSPAIAAIISVLIIPVLGNRIEIRPEIFSYLFCGLFFWILWNYHQEKINWRWLLILPLVEIFWISLHIYFFLGPALIGAFLIDRFVNYLTTKNKKIISQLKWLLIALIFTALTSLINPAGVNGVLYPLKIFKNYGYRLFENQSIWFIEKLMNYPPILYFKIVFGALIISWIAAFYLKIKNRAEFSIANFIIAAAFGAAGFLAIRNFPLFAYFALPITAINLKNSIKKESGENEKPEYFTTTILATIILIVLIIINPTYWRNLNNIGLGLEPAADKAAEFFKKEKLTGPIFNNYDIGSYLIYYLYPEERVFVDNRPEAYPESFFEETYVPMQEKEENWQKELKKYNFNAIFFYSTDLPPCAQNFLTNRVSDPDWAPVYVDNYNIIFLMRVALNQPIIKKYKLPKNIFNINPQ